MKRILFTAPNVAEYLDAPKPAVRPGCALVRTLVSSISSGTERANITGEATVSYAVDAKTAAENIIFPRAGGYSTCGIVEEVGEGVRSVKVGDRVAMSWTTHCEYNVVSEDRIYVLPDNISDNAAALIHISTFPMAAVRKCRTEIGESAVVMGLGVLGLIATQILHTAGAVPVIAVDPNPIRRAQAMKFGADYALDPFEEGFTAKVKELTGGGAKVAIEVTGNGNALNMVLDCMARFGRVALLGCTRHSDFNVDYYRKVHGPGITLIGAHTNARPEHESHGGWWTQRDDALAMIKLLSTGRMNFDQMIEEVHSPTEAPEVYHRLCTEKSFPVVQFDWRT